MGIANLLERVAAVDHRTHSLLFDDLAHLVELVCARQSNGEECLSATENPGQEYLEQKA